MTKYTANVIFQVGIELDETKFDEAFLAEFRASFYPFFDIDDHVMHLAQLEARGLLEDFTEGYGPIKDMGIKGTTVDWQVEDVKAITAPTEEKAL